LVERLLKMTYAERETLGTECRERHVFKANSGATKCFVCAHERRGMSLDLAEGAQALTAAGTRPVNETTGTSPEKF
jgi:hypothetical protein